MCEEPHNTINRYTCPMYNPCTLKKKCAKSYPHSKNSANPLPDTFSNSTPYEEQREHKNPRQT